uniref:tRNA-dihydrouridine synthase family protein n=1 Tax=Eubacterium cellulosolvens TaxID=29322 RepID=UPI0006852266|nr:tRNA-dihydrouridine synthase family protein [[Eubacterium] cellulosolvens]
MTKEAQGDVFSFAPMEGITNVVFRNAHHAVFPGTQRYYTPFLGLNQNMNLQKKEWRDIDPENQLCVDGTAEVIPQVLTCHADQFLWAAQMLADRGYGEINLNTGCPAPTVVTRHKGAGLLEKPVELEILLDEIFDGIGRIHTGSGKEMRVSVKTRTGMKSHDEAEALMEVFDRYPFSEIIIHPRVREEYYKGKAHPEVFASCAGRTAKKLCYNGDIYTAENWRERKKQFPEVTAWMFGRGFVTDPALVRQIQGGKELEAGELLEFHDRILDGYLQMGTEDRNAMFRLFELWTYWRFHFQGADKCLKKLKKTKSLADYRARVNELFAEADFAPGFYDGLK